MLIILVVLRIIDRGTFFSLSFCALAFLIDVSKSNKHLAVLTVMIHSLQVVQEFILGVYDAEATAAFNQNLSDISTLKDPRSKDASQRYCFVNRWVNQINNNNRRISGCCKDRKWGEIQTV